MKSPIIRMPLRSLNRKKKKEQPQLKENKIKPCPSSPVNLSSASSLTQTSSYSSCTSSLASSTQTRKSAEPPGWVHNPPPRTLNEEISANNGLLLKENNAPNNNNNNYPPSNTPRRQWTHQRTAVPSPVCIRSSPQPPQSNTMPSSYQRQNIMTHTMSENTIQMTYSESSGSEGSSISSLGLNAESNDDQLLDFERYECVEEIDRMTKSKDWTVNNFDLCNGGYGGGGGQQSLKNLPTSTMSSKSVDIESQISFPQTHLREERTSVTMDSAEQRMEEVEEELYFCPGDRFNPNASPQTRCDATGDANNDASCRPEEGEEEEISNCAAPTVLLDMNRMQDIYGSMMVAFRKKIMAELREEMQKEMQHQLFALKNELSEMNTRLTNLEKNQTSAPNFQQGLQQSSSTIETNILKEITSKVLNDKEQQQKQLEAMLDAKLAKAMDGVRVEMNLAVHEMKKEGDRLSKMTGCAESPPHGKKSSNKVSWNCTSTKGKEEGLGCESALINGALQSIDFIVTI
ncbi:hypothetical protein QTG54_012809 [Skeletonema marinoi]|uniref:Uncharacterized protein n=1 Tax=Skeletonema marinoi TaxID=267567 RepID=A0AAD8XZV9_9STRA|nr:hypothetical protein QTG54_012809 [Skeletonema marinoi]